MIYFNFSVHVRILMFNSVETRKKDFRNFEWFTGF